MQYTVISISLKKKMERAYVKKQRQKKKSVTSGRHSHTRMVSHLTLPFFPLITVISLILSSLFLPI